MTLKCEVKEDNNRSVVCSFQFLLYLDGMLLLSTANNEGRLYLQVKVKHYSLLTNGPLNISYLVLGIKQICSQLINYAIYKLDDSEIF